MRPLALILTTLIAGHAFGATSSYDASCSGVYDFDALATNPVVVSSTRCIYSAPAPVKTRSGPRDRLATKASVAESGLLVSAVKPKTEKPSVPEKSNKAAHVQELAKRLMSSADFTKEMNHQSERRVTALNKNDSVEFQRSPSVKSASNPTWRIPAGEKLSDAIKRWGEQNGWKIIWKPDYDYVVKAPLQYQAQFLDAVKLLFSDYAKAKRPFYVDAYRPQKIIVITPGGAS